MRRALQKISLRLCLICTILAVPRGASAQAFSPDEIAIYRELLLHYPLEPGDLLGMESLTRKFPDPDSLGDRSQLRKFRVIPPVHSGRILPTEILSLADRNRIMHLLAAQHKLVAPSKLTPQLRADGFARTHFTVSEIAYDANHHFAAIVFGAECGCLGGDGGTAIFEHTPTGWRLIDTVDVWEG